MEISEFPLRILWIRVLLSGIDPIAQGATTVDNQLRPKNNVARCEARAVCESVLDSLVKSMVSLEAMMGTLETTANTPLGSQTDDLLKAAKAGDPDAYQTLTERAAPIIFRRALEITANHHDAEDVLQETLLKGFTHISQFRGDAQLSTWLVRIGLNEAMMTLRKRRRDVPLAPEAGPTGRVEESPTAFQGDKAQTDSRITGTEMGGLLNKALRRLPARARQVLHLRYLEGYSIEETASRLNLSRGSVKAYACRSRARLRKELRRLLMPHRRGTKPQ